MSRVVMRFIATLAVVHGRLAGGLFSVIDVPAAVRVADEVLEELEKEK